MNDRQDPGYYPYFPPVQIRYSANAAFADPDGPYNAMQHRFPETYLQIFGDHHRHHHQVGDDGGGGGNGGGGGGNGDGGVHAPPAAMHHHHQQQQQHYAPGVAPFHAQRAGYIAERDALHRQRRELLNILWERKGELHRLLLEYARLEDMEDEEELAMGEGLVEVYNKQKDNKLDEVRVRTILRRLEDELRVNMEKIEEGRAKQRELTVRARGGQ